MELAAKKTTLMWMPEGPLMRYGDGTLEIEDLNPEVKLHWRFSRWELLSLAIKCFWAAAKTVLTITAIFAALATLIFAHGCAASATPGRQKVEQGEAIYYEQSVSNLHRHDDGWEKAYRIERNKTIDLELNNSLNVAPPLTAAEVGAVYAKAAQRRADTETAIANYHAQRVKDEQTNLANARRARDTLKGPAPEAPLDLGQQIDGAAGTTPPAPTLIGK